MTHEETPSLESLLAPISVDTFMDEHWGKKPLFVKGSRQKLQGLDYGLSTVQSFASNRRARLKVGFPDVQDQYQEIPVDPAHATSYFLAGMTLCYGGVDELHGPLARLAASVRARLGYPHKVYFNSYLSPPDKGIMTHFDPQGVITLQVEGTKRWRWAPGPVLEHPLMGTASSQIAMLSYAEEYPWARVPPPEEEGFAHAVLEPGDLLYLPAGTWHATSAAEYSLGLTLTFEPVSMLDLLQESLREMLASDTAFRAALPLEPPLREREGAAALDRWLDEHLVAASDALVTRLAGKMRSAYAARTGRAPAPAPEDSGSPPAPVGRRDCLELVHPTYYKLEREADGEERVYLSCMPTDPTRIVPHELVLERELLPFARGLLDARSFRAESALLWQAEEPRAAPRGALRWEDLRPCLEHLVAMGYLRHAARPADEVGHSWRGRPPATRASRAGDGRMD